MSDTEDAMTEEEFVAMLDSIDKKKKVRKDKYFNLGFCWLHYIHYYPNSVIISSWGFQTSHWKNFTIDFYFGKHVIVFSFGWMR